MRCGHDGVLGPSCKVGTGRSCVVDTPDFTVLLDATSADASPTSFAKAVVDMFFGKGIRKKVPVELVLC